MRQWGNGAMEHPKHASAAYEILDVIRQRWSPRAFDETRDVAADQLLRLFEAARWAPSSLNEQPWRFVVANRHRNADAFQGLLATLHRSNTAWASRAPVLILVVVSKTLELTGTANQHAWYDAGQAVGFLTLQATAMALAVRQMEGFDRARAGEACGIPSSFEPAVVMAVGYVGDPDSLDREKHRRLEREPRIRRPVSEFVFEGTWGRTLKL
jgi:nitroreductase